MTTPTRTPAPPHTHTPKAKPKTAAPALADHRPAPALADIAAHLEGGDE